MNIYTTSGTPEFMEQVRAKHADKKMVVMHGRGNSILLHETDGKTVFQTPRKFEVIGSSGTLQEEGYFVFDHVPVTDEGRPVFEHHFESRVNAVDDKYGFIALRLLRPIGSDTYVILTEWSDAKYYTMWKDSPASGILDAMKTSEVGADNRPHIFSSAPYVTTYTTVKKEEQA